MVGIALGWKSLLLKNGGKEMRDLVFLVGLIFKEYVESNNISQYMD
jgi:hypothetical protein